MTVPQDHLPYMEFSRQIRSTFPFRPHFLRHGSAFCGTAIAVPYMGSTFICHCLLRSSQKFRCCISWNYVPYHPSLAVFRRSIVYMFLHKRETMYRILQPNCHFRGNNSQKLPGVAETLWAKGRFFCKLMNIYSSVLTNIQYLVIIRA